MTTNRVLLSVALVTVIAVALLGSQRDPVVDRRDPAVGKAVFDRVQLSMAAATARNDQAARLCEADVNAILGREFAEIERQAETAAVEVSSLGSCTAIIYRLAKEKLGSTASTAGYVEGQIRGRIQPALDTCAQELDSALDRYEVALRGSTVTLATELAQANPAPAGRPIDVAVDIRTDGDLDRALGNLGLNGGIVSVAGGFDAVAIMNTSIVRSLITKIAQLAASVFAKPAATAAGSAIVAAADGPLPVGDVLAVLGGIWTGYEVYATRRQFEHEIRLSLGNALPEMKRSVHTQLMERIRSLQSDYQRAQDRIRNDVAAALTR
jgi:hypothetical protein